MERPARLVNGGGEQPGTPAGTALVGAAAGMGLEGSAHRGRAGMGDPGGVTSL